MRTEGRVYIPSVGPAGTSLVNKLGYASYRPGAYSEESQCFRTLPNARVEGLQSSREQDSLPHGV